MLLPPVWVPSRAPSADDFFFTALSSKKASGMTAHAFLSNVADPTSLKQTRSSSNAADWDSAIHQELDALKNKGTYTLVPLPPDRKAIGSKWVYCTKFKPDGSMLSF